MKKYYLILALLCTGFLGYSQNLNFLSLMDRKQKPTFYNSRIAQQPNQATRINNVSYGTSIGLTSYDLQSNHSTGSSRILKYPDGTITTVWAQSLDINGNHPDRGTGYCYYDPVLQQWNNMVSWYGINTTRTGWPQILHVSLGEFTIQHDYGASRIVTNQRDTIGQGFWGVSQGHNIDAVWPRAVSVGDTIHMISVDNQVSQVNGIENPVEYHRSDDAGLTWSILKYHDFPNYSDSTFWFGTLDADAYALDAYRNYVAFVIGGGWDPVVLYKSDNYGEPGSWTRTLVFRPDSSNNYNDVSNSQFITPTLSSEFSIVIDKSGLVHLSTTGFAVSWSYTESKPQDPSDDQYYYPLASAGIYYWNETMGTVDHVYNSLVNPNMLTGNVLNPISQYEDYTNDGMYNIPGDKDSIGAYHGGVAGQTAISVDQDSGVYIVWSQVAELTMSVLQQAYRDLYFAHSFDAGNTWKEIINLASLEVADDGLTGGTLSEEDVFPSTVKRVDGDDKLHMVFQTDVEPGMHVQGDLHQIGYSDIVYYPIDISYFRALTAADETSAVKGDLLVYPNPVENLLHFEAQNAGINSIRIYNLLGRKLEEIKVSDSQYVDLSHLESGVYLIRFEDSGKEITRKIVKQ